MKNQLAIQEERDMYEKDPAEYLRLRHFEQKKSFAAIGCDLGISKGRVHYLIHKYNIPVTKSRHESRRSPILYAAAKLYFQDAYLKRGLSQQGIAAELQCSQSNVSVWLLEMGIK